MKRTILALLLTGFPALMPFFACTSAIPTARENERFAVTAYSFGRGRPVEHTPAGKLTHIIYSFLHLKGNALAIDRPGDSASIASLVSLKELNPALRIMLSLGGWGGCASCSEVFATERGRREFALSTLRVLRETRTDGIDIDWEYPSIEGYPGHSFSPEDREHFTQLMMILRETLGGEYEVSFAAGGFTQCILASVDWKQVMLYADRVNLMTYDLVNANSTVTGHQTALFSGPGQPESVDNAVRLLDSLGVAPGQIIIGAAFYARVWGGVRDTNNGLFQPGRFARFIPYRELDEYFQQHAGFRKFRDTASEAPFAYSSSQGLFATYDDPVSVGMKTRYALEHGLGGIMFWELSGDSPSNGLLDAIDSVRAAASRRR